MLDARVRRLIDPVLDRVGQALAAAGVSALAVTVTGLGLGFAAAVAIAQGAYLVGLLFIVLSRIADGLDGAVARSSQPTAFGGFADSMADFAFYAWIPFAFAVAAPERAMAAAFLLMSFIASGVAFLNYAVLAARLGEPPSDHKAFVYAAGLTEGTETIALFILMALVPAWFEPLAWGFGVLCWVTAIARTRAAWRLANR
jgi:phosphatidylglycerophosphate synthase